MSRSSAIKTFVLIFIIFPCLVKAVLIFKEHYNDEEALSTAHTHFKPVVLIKTENEGNATGTVINVPDRPDLEKRVILTNAHVINNKISKIYREGLAPDVDSEEPLDDNNALEFLPPRAHPAFKKGDESLRKYDYGVVILKEPLNIEPLSLSDEQLTAGTPITIVGYGQKYAPYAGDTLGPLSDLKKRAFGSIITEAHNEERIFYTHINEDTRKNYAFPFTGDSGAPVFRTSQQDKNTILGIVSGFVNEQGTTAYINPSINDVSSLLIE